MSLKGLTIFTVLCTLPDISPLDSWWIFQLISYISVSAGGRLADPDLVAALAGLESDPGTHRLQRQDAKSRKTFKIKRTKTKTSTNIRRFMSARRGRYEVSDHEGSSEDSPIRTPGRMSDTAVVFHDRSSFTLRRPGVAVARSVETIPESVEVKVHPKAARV